MGEKDINVCLWVFTIVLYTICSVGEKDINVCLWVFIIVLNTICSVGDKDINVSCGFYNSTVHFMLCGREGY